jgi:translation elongation factor EF-G
MKNLKKVSILVVLMTFVISCTGMKDTKSNTITGKVDSIEAGKDGYTAKISTAAKEVYFATISIVNVGGPQNYKQLKIGDTVSVKGEIWKAEEEKHIKVTEIISVK